MGFLIGEIIAFLAGAALVGVLIGWALFGGKKAAAGTADAPAAPDGEALAKLEARIKSLEAERDALQGNLTERDEKIAELRNHLDETSRYRVEMADELGRQQDRVKALEEQLRQRAADTGAGGEGGATDAVVAELRQQLAEKDETIARLEAALAESGAAVPAAPRVAQLEAEIAELKATLESGGQLVTEGDVGAEKDTVIARLEEEITGLRAAYEAAERSLEEQDGAIDQLTQDLVKAQQKIAQLEAQRSQGVVEAEVVPVPPVPPPDDDDDDAADEATIAMPAFDLPEETAPEAPAVTAADTPEVGDGDEADEATIAMAAFELPGDEADEDEPTKAIAAFEVVEEEEIPPVPPVPPVPPPVPSDSPATASDGAEPPSVGGRVAPPAEGPGALPPAPEEVAEPAAPEPTPAGDEPPATDERGAGAGAEASAGGQDEAPAEVADASGEATEAPAGVEEAAAETDEAPPAGDGEATGAALPVAPEGVKDDLKKIKGIGPALEKRLNNAGIMTFAQLAALTDDQLAELAEAISVSTDKIKKKRWIAQAQALLEQG